MDIQDEVRKLRAVVGSEAVAIELMESLIRAILIGVEPSSIIEKLNCLEVAERLGRGGVR